MANSIDQIAIKYYSPKEWPFSILEEAKGEICTVELFPALWQKVCEWATYAFALITSGGGLFKARPEMPGLSLNRERYHLTVTFKLGVGDPNLATRVEDYIISNVAQKLLGLKKDSLELERFEEQNKRSISSLLIRNYEADARLSFEVVALPSLLDNEQNVNFSAFCKATMTVRSSCNLERTIIQEETIDLMQAKIRAQEAV